MKIEIQEPDEVDIVIPVCLAGGTRKLCVSFRRDSNHDLGIDTEDWWLFLTYIFSYAPAHEIRRVVDEYEVNE